MRTRNKFIITLGLSTAGASILLYGHPNIFAFSGPTNDPGIGGGIITSDSNRNLGIGTSTDPATRLRIVPESSANPNDYILKVLQPGGAPVFFIRNDGKISMSTTTASSTLTVAGTIYADNILGDTFTGTISAGNVTPGVFNGVAGGNYVFNGSLGIATTTQVSLPAPLTVYATSAFLGNIGINTASPQAALDIKGRTDSSQLIVRAHSIQTAPVVKFLGPAGNEIGRIHMEDDFTSNIFIGAEAGQNSDIGLGNTAVGTRALADNTTGYGNVAVGHAVMTYNTTGFNNTGVGDSVLVQNTTGRQNSALGHNALTNNTTGLANVGVGYYALFNNQTGNRNVAVGNDALKGYLLASENTALGYSAGHAYPLIGGSGAGNGNVFIGSLTGYQSGFGGAASSSYNVFIGYSAGQQIGKAAGSRNVFIGSGAGYNNNSSNKLIIANNSSTPPLIYGDFITNRLSIATTTASGTLMVAGDIFATGNITCGGSCGGGGGGGVNGSGNVNTIPLWTGASTLGNSLIVQNAGNVGINTSSSQATLEVRGTADKTQLLVRTASSQTFANPIFKIINSSGGEMLRINSSDAPGVPRLYIGMNSGAGDTNGWMDGNTAVGHNTLRFVTTGGWNTALGYGALLDTTTGAHNTALGFGALGDNTTGGNNVAVGENALALSTNAYFNVGIGLQALVDNTTGYWNTAVGAEALRGYITGQENTAVGRYAGYASISGSPVSNGSQNVFIGTWAGAQAGGSTATNNVFIGYSAGQQIGRAAGSRNVFIGNNAGYNDNRSDKFYLANSGTNVLLYGDFALGRLRIGSNTSTPPAHLHVRGATSTTVRIGDSAASGCIEMGNSNGTPGINYITVLNGTLSVSTTKPPECM